MTVRTESTKHRVALVVSGNLASDTIALVWHKLSSDRSLDCHLFSDGYVIGDFRDFPSLRGVEELVADPGAYDLVVMSIRSPGDIERRIMRASSAAGVLCLLVLADSGSGAQKFWDGSGFVWPTRLCIGDSVTWAALRDAGAPERILIPAGNPYLDFVSKTVASRPHVCSVRSLYFCDVPNREDFETWGRPVAYTEADVLSGVISATRARPSWQVVVRRHPKQGALTACCTPSIHEDDRTEPIHQALPGHAICVSSYSTALLVATLLSIPAVSYQPHGSIRIRQKLYDTIGIRVTSTPSELGECLDDLPTPSPQRLQEVLFNYGRSLEVVAGSIYSLLGSSSCEASYKDRQPVQP